MEGAKAPLEGDGSNIDFRLPTPDQPGGSTPLPDGGWPGLKICSVLDFDGLTWSANVAHNDRDIFALALNISGSFEGVTGWANLTDDFDGQGISMGLLNQNLGQGSLQPLWLEMRNGHPARMAQLISAANLTSMNGMLDKWQKATGTASLTDYGYSELDDPALIPELPEVQIALTKPNQDAVDWARATLYQNGKFKAAWAQQLTALAESAEYRSIQLRKAETLHRKARELVKLYGTREWRSYLFFFDILVQNGGIPASVRDKFLAWEKKNPGASETARLTALLEYRLEIVNSRWVADVRARKMSLINGKGKVHGASRDYAAEFCTNLRQTL